MCAVCEFLMSGTLRLFVKMFAVRALAQLRRGAQRRNYYYYYYNLLTDTRTSISNDVQTGKLDGLQRVHSTVNTLAILFRVLLRVNTLLLAMFQ